MIAPEKRLIMSQNQSIIAVAEAEKLIQNCRLSLGDEWVPLPQANGRILAKAITADRDLPPFNRVAMDGIALKLADFEAGTRQFKIDGVVPAGAPPPTQLQHGTCFEIMTGAALPADADLIIPYEQLDISHGIATVKTEVIKPGQHIHLQGIDTRAGAVLIAPGRRLGAAEISVAASVGKATILVKKLPRVVVYSSGDELVPVETTPLSYQIRRSNSHALYSMLQPYGIDATLRHLPESLEPARKMLHEALHQFDVVLLSGGVSMGKFDFIPQILEENGVTQVFHKVRQRPGKPFWFGTFAEKAVVFALPGNPVSTFLCMLRYVQPWLEATLGYPTRVPYTARLTKAVTFSPSLQYFMAVALHRHPDGQIEATPWSNNGSGDFASLLGADGFLELPEDQTEFPAGASFRVWSYR
jgi:molybdopterin molybdotransferase